jgi:hypothetical protein
MMSHTLSSSLCSFDAIMQAKGKVDFVDISTPLSAEDYLNAYRGMCISTCI